MKIVKTKEITLHTDDAYILSGLRDYVVTNDESGFCLYDKELNFIKKMCWQENYGAYMVYRYFHKNKLLLDCSEDGFLLYADLDSEEFRRIPFNYPYAEYEFLGHIYNWTENHIVFKSPKQYIYVNVDKKSADVIDEEALRKIDNPFYCFCQKIEQLKFPRAMPGPFECLYTVDDEHVGYYNFVADTVYQVRTPKIIDHPIGYMSKRFVFLNANNIQVIDAEGKASTVEADKHQEFLIAQFQNDGDELIVLNSQYIKKRRVDFLTKYTI